jgi:hypothetical protein
MGTGDQYPPPSNASRLGMVGGGDVMRDAQADVPSTGWLRAQLAFKNSMVHGILQFTPSIAFCYVLHRCVSRDIRCQESFKIKKKPHACAHRERGVMAQALLSFVFLGTYRAGGCCCANLMSMSSQRGDHGHKSTRLHEARHRSIGPRQAMLLVHVHGSFCYAGFDNDPSAGSPTETLLRLLLPLNDKVQWNSRDVAGSEPPTSPRS